MEMDSDLGLVMGLVWVMPLDLVLHCKLGSDSEMDSEKEMGLDLV